MIKIQKICVLAIVIVFSMTSFVFAENTDRIRFGGITVEAEAEVTTVTVEVLSKPAGESATLVAMYKHPDTGRILSVNGTVYADISAVDGNSISVSLPNKESEGGKLSYYVWNSLSGSMSLLNHAPSIPRGFSATAEVSSASLAWEPSLDDFTESDNIKYNIYDEGILIKENCTDSEYTANKLAPGIDYNFEVRAVDEEGLESKSGYISAKTNLKNTVLTTSEVTSSYDGNLEFTGSETENTRNFYCKKNQAGGLDCYSTTLRSDNTGTFLTYRFSTDYYAELAGTKRFVCELTYFDEGNENIKLGYFFSSDGSTYDRTTTFTQKTNTRTWKTVRKIYTFAEGEAFIDNPNMGNGYFTFRLKSDNDNIGLKVRSFSVYPIYDDGRNEEYLDVIKKNTGSYFIADGATFACDMSADAEGLFVETIDGRDCVELSSIADNSFDFKVTDAELQTGNVNVIISYYATDAETRVSLNGEEQAIGTERKWQKMCFEYTDLGTGLNSITANNNIYINSVRVVMAD